MPESFDAEEKKFKRSYKACLNCRTRKVKCDGWDSEPPCTRCRRERKECIFVESRRGGHGNVLAGKKRKAEIDAEHNRKIPSNASLNQLWPLEVQQRLSGSIERPDAQFGDRRSSNSDHNDQANPVGKSHGNNLPSPTSLLQTTDGSVLNPYTRKMLSMGEESELPPLKQFPLPQSDVRSSTRDIYQKDLSRDINRIDPAGTGALQFLAKAAGNIARADQRDRINAMERHNALEADSSGRLGSHSSSEGFARGSFPTSATSTPSYTASPDPQQRASAVPPIIKANNSGARSTMPPPEDSKSLRPKPSTKLSDIEYIGEHSILTESAARKYINLFFSTMHPFFPHIPPDLMEPDRLAGYPILLCAILTISSRYHSFAELEGREASSNEMMTDEGDSAHIEVHERLWVYCQRLISQTVWAEASTRSIGTVFAFLLFTEWNPRAIHWRWSDYANSDEGAKAQGLDTSEEGVAGLGAMRRSARMGWMLIGSAVRLAQDMGFMENSSRIFLACHVSETFAAMNVSKRSMLSNSLSEIDLESDDEEEVVAQQNQPKVKRKTKNKEADEIDLVLMGDEENLRMKTDTKLKFSRMQKAKIELLQIMSICYETLYGVKPKDGSAKRQNLAILNILSPLLENWYRTYKDLLVPTISSHYTANTISSHSQMIVKPQSKYTKDIGKQLDIESLIFDYYYAKLYIYSLALTDYSNAQSQTARSKKSHHLRLDELSKSSKYVELAFNASKEMLSCTQRLHKIRMLKYMPVRWVTRIVRAVAFVVKCYLTMTASQSSHGNVNSSIMALSIIPLDEIMSIIQKVAITLREASPDELHLCTRYSTILMYLCSEMKSKISTRTSFNVDYEATDMDKTEAVDNYEEDEYHSQGPSAQDAYATSNSGEFEERAEMQDQQSTSYNMPSSQNKSNKTDYDIFAFPSDTVFDWFKNDNGGGIGLDFVEPWTEMIEQQININKID